MTFTQLAELIGDTLAKAPEADKQKLAQAIEDYADARHATWSNMQRGTTGALLEAIVEAVEAMPGIQAQRRQMEAEERRLQG
jgi:acyl-CoA reductase-like NAD-dependent aldehyde dehydrogenase